MPTSCGTRIGPALPRYGRLQWPLREQYIRARRFACVCDRPESSLGGPPHSPAFFSGHCCVEFLQNAHAILSSISSPLVAGPRRTRLRQTFLHGVLPDRFDRHILQIAPNLVRCPVVILRPIDGVAYVRVPGNHR